MKLSSQVMASALNMAQEIQLKMAIEVMPKPWSRRINVILFFLTNNDLFKQFSTLKISMKKLNQLIPF